MKPEPVRTLIVDDEGLVRERLRGLLADRTDVEVVGECDDGAFAATTILATRPELVLLDIQMPELSGFDVLRIVSDEYLPAVIFVTAYDEYALRAFEVHALDYLMKPIDPGRLEDAVTRAVELVRARQAGNLRALVGSLFDEAPRPERIAARKGQTLQLLRPEEIDCVDAAGNYLRLRSGGHTYLVRSTMKDMERRLGPARFLRIHRSTLVNAERVVSLSPRTHGEYDIELTDGTRVRSSRTYLANVKRLPAS